MIKFTQYLRPHGRKTQIEIDRSDEIEEMAAELALKGVALEAEILSGNVVSFTASWGGKEIAGVLSSNGPQVEEKVDELIRMAQRRVNGEPEPEPPCDIGGGE